MVETVYGDQDSLYISMIYIKFYNSYIYIYIYIYISYIWNIINIVFPVYIIVIEGYFA